VMSKGAEATSQGSELGVRGGRKWRKEAMTRPAQAVQGGRGWPNKRGPHVSDWEERRCQGEIHKPERKTYSREYANDT
jgi:hypothetical protein